MWTASWRTSRSEEASARARSPPLRVFYAGEVLVRGFGFRWVIADMPEFELPEVMQYAIVAPHRDGATSFIVTKAFKRVENGDEDSLAFFGEALRAGMNNSSND